MIRKTFARTRGYREYTLWGLLLLASILDLLSALDLDPLLSAFGLPEKTVSLIVLVVSQLGIASKFARSCSYRRGSY